MYLLYFYYECVDVTQEVFVYEFVYNLFFKCDSIVL